MVRRLWVVRILGVASTTHGFAYAVVEDSKRLVDYGFRTVRTETGMLRALAKIAGRVRPMMVACEPERKAHKTKRGAVFLQVLSQVSEQHKAFLVSANRSILQPPRPLTLVTNRDVVDEVAKRFPTLARRLPKERRQWDGPDDRLGVFLAAFAAVAALDGSRSKLREAER